MVAKANYINVYSHLFKLRHTSAKNITLFN